MEGFNILKTAVETCRSAIYRAIAHRTDRSMALHSHSTIEDYIFEDSVSASRRPGYARPTVNHLTVMNYVKLNRLNTLAARKKATLTEREGRFFFAGWNAAVNYKQYRAVSKNLVW